MSLSHQLPTVKAEFDPSFKPTASGGMALWLAAARSLGFYRALFQHIPDDLQALVVQLAAGLSLGGRGQAAADLVSQDSKLKTLLGICEAVGPKRVHAKLTKLAGRKVRRRCEAYRKVEAPNGAGVKRYKRIATEVVTATPEAMEPLSRVRWSVVERAFKKMDKEQFKLGEFYGAFIDGSLLETHSLHGELVAKDRKGNRSILFMGFWLGPLLLEYELYPGNTEEGTVAVEMLSRGMKAVERLGISPDKVLLLADSAYGQGHILQKLNSLEIKYIVGMNRQREHLNKKIEEFPKTYWKATSAPSRGNRSEEFCVFYYAAKDWEKNAEVFSIRFKVPGELFTQTSFLASNLALKDENKLPQKCRADILPSTIWRCYDRKQRYENYQKDLLCDLGMHHPSSSRACLNQVLYEIAAIALTIGVFLSRTVLPGPFQNARLWRIARTLYNISATITRHGRYLKVRLSTAPEPPICLAWSVAWERLTKRR